MNQAINAINKLKHVVDQQKNVEIGTLKLPRVSQEVGRVQG